MELYIEPIRHNRNMKTGRFLKGHRPHNQGKRMNEYMTKSKIQNVKQNLHKGRGRKGPHKMSGWNKKSVIAIFENNIFGVFESSVEAARKLNLNDRNIRLCCEGKRKKCGKINWFFEKDVDKWSKLLIE
jgi:hypothetical protein